MSRSLTQRDKSILLVLLLVVVLALVYLLGVRPALDELANVATQRASLEQTLASLGEMHARQQQQEQKGKTVLSRVPIGPHEANALEIINQIAQKDKVTLVSVQIPQGGGAAPAGSTAGSGAGAIPAGGGLQSLQYNLTITGSASDVESFFDDIVRAPRLFTVTLQSETGTASGATANFTLYAYYRTN